MAPAELEKVAQRELSAGNLRQARDTFKELVRIDRDRFLPDLIRCYVAQAAEMAAGGRLGELKTIVDHLKHLDPAQKHWNETQCRPPDTAGAAPAAGSRAGVVPRSSDLTPADRALCFDDDTLSDDPLFLQDLGQVRAALEALSRNEPDVAIEALRPLGTKSAFADWKLCVRGMVTFYSHDDAKAITLLAKVPALSAAGRMAAPFLALLDEKGEWLAQAPSRERLVEKAFVAAGYADFAIDIARADYLWSRGRFRDSFNEIRDNIGSLYTSPDWLLLLLRHLYFKLPHTLDHTQADKYIAHLGDRIMSPSNNPNPAELIFFLRLISQQYMPDDNFDVDSIVETWENYLGFMRQSAAFSPRFAAEIFQMLGRGFMRESHDDPFSRILGRPSSRNEMMDSAAAEKYLKKSLDEYDGDADVWVDLALFYQKTKRDRDRAQLLERAAAKFPGHVGILTSAASACFARKTWPKGFDYLERACKLDPMNSQCLQMIIDNSIQAAVDCLNKKDFKKMRRFLNLGVERTVPGSGEFSRGRAAMLIRCATCEHIAGDAAGAEEYLKLARSDAAWSAGMLYFAGCGYNAAVVGLNARMALQTEIDTVFSNMASLKSAVSLTQAFDFALSCKMIEPHRVKSESKRIVKYAVAAAATDQFDRVSVGSLIGFALDRHDTTSAKNILKKVPDTCKDDPLFIFYTYICRWPNPRQPSPGARTIRLKDILIQAQRRNDAATAALIECALKEIPSEHPAPFPQHIDDFESVFDRMVDDLVGIPRRRTKKPKKRVPPPKRIAPVAPVSKPVAKRPVIDAEQTSLF
jgi:tetratricopeptide (TPR) repeat protein